MTRGISPSAYITPWLGLHSHTYMTVEGHTEVNGHDEGQVQPEGEHDEDQVQPEGELGVATAEEPPKVGLHEAGP